jgi:predicted PurR-regulated permease PerM
MPETSTETEYPIYIKVPAVLLSLVLGVWILYILGDILVPVAFAVLIAILLNPLYSWLEKLMPKVPAILVTLLVASVVIAALFYFLSTQIGVFTDSLPELKKKISMLLIELQGWSRDKFGINIQKQVTAVTTSLNGGGSGEMLANTIGPVLTFVSVVLLLPTYVFLLLYYKPLMLDFLFQVFSEKHSLRVAEILSQTKSAVQSFMQGLMLETVIVSALNSVALLIIGVPSAIVIGVIGGILNLIPYVGGLIAIALPVLMVTVTQDGFSGQLAVIIAYLVIQFFDNNILMPRVVSSKVQVNALISIVGVLLGGALWGVAGMFLSIPTIGVLKIIFDRIDGLKPWGSLLGTEVPSEHMGLIWQQRWERIFRTMEKKKKQEEKLAVEEKLSNDEDIIKSNEPA